MPRIIVFDVNETLLDLRALDPLFKKVFGDTALRPLWFAQMLQLSFVGTITGIYVDFTIAQHAALRMLAMRQDRALSDANAERIVGAMRTLPAYPDVQPALRCLVDAGFRLAALTNSVREVAEAQLTHAGLRACFEQVLSADQVRRLKPAPEPYRMVAEQFGVPVSDLRLVAAHAWDVSGALAVGCRAAFVRRPGMVPSPIGPQPDMVGRDMGDIARQILEQDR
jgi:2-haloacid dehalogenase